MKETPTEKKIFENFLPGKISRTGFLGYDQRHIHDIIQADERALSQLGVTREMIAEKLQYFIEQGKPGLESKVELENFSVQLQWSRGNIPCPFGEPGLHPKIVATVINKKQQRQIQYSQLNVHMIRVHGFFEGIGSAFRLAPTELVKFLELNDNSLSATPERQSVA